MPTHNRPDRLALCLHSLLNLRYPAYEIIVVDNAPTTAETAEVVQEMQKSAPFLFYLREDRPGISWARNKGIAIAKGEIIAFTDDDVVVDPYWLTELVYAFTLSADVACTTGAILPLELETPAQLLFERLKRRDAPPQEVRLQPQLIIRESSGAPLQEASSSLPT